VKLTSGEKSVSWI